MSRQVGPEDDCNWTYPGSNTNVPTIMVLRPTWEEFKDFNKYLKKIEDMGAHKGGVAKIIPPKEWVPRKEKFDIEKCEIKISDPIEQVVNGNRGIYNCINMRKKSMTAKEFYKKATSAKYKTPQMTDIEDVERKYWKNITFVAPIYGADVPGYITDRDCKHWNIQNLGSILDMVNDDYNVKIAGVNTAYLYFGMWKSAFAWHTEDMDLHSINYLHYGESKFWYAIPPEYARRFERMALGLFPQFAKECSSYLRHKMCMISPNVLRQNSIPYNKIAQKEGEIMITFPLGYHSGFNTGFNVAESTNFATERWVEYGKRATRCHCRPDTVNISMDCFVKRLQPDRYDDWLNGQDYGRHPEEPNAKLTPANPPTAEEFMVNNRNKDKKIPLCLLEPKEKKKRRHPIHKNKNLAVPRGRMLSMSVAGEDESSYCVDVDEDEPTNKVARSQEHSSSGIPGKCENVISKSFLDIKSTEHIAHTSELWNGLDTIKRSNESRSIARTKEEKKNLLESTTIKVEPIAIGKDAPPLQGLNHQTPNNLVDTISRLQRSLSKTTLPIVTLQSPMKSTLNINATRTESQVALLNASQNMTINTNGIRNDLLKYSSPSLVNYMHHSKDSQTSMQAAQPQTQLSNKLYIPFLSQHQLPSSGMGNANLLPPPSNLLQRSNTSSSTLNSAPHIHQGSNSIVTNYLGSLSPIQASYLKTMPNSISYTPNATELQAIKTDTECKTSLPFTTSYTSNLQKNHIHGGIRTITPMYPSQRTPPLHLTATTSNLSLLQNLGMQDKLNSGQSFLNSNTKNSSILIAQRFSNDVPRADWARNNQLILTSKDRRQIKTSVTILDKQRNGSPWQPPLKLPVGNAWGWQVNGFVNMFESAIYINLHGPRNMARSFMLPFKNILATTKKSQVAINAKQEIWPPSDDMLALCEDVSRWELHMCINPNTDIKATIIDPWKKTYLLTIPGKLLA